MSYHSKYNVKIPELSPKLAYTCGFLLGDGSIQIREHKHDYAIKAVGNPKDEQSYYDVIIKALFLEIFNIPITTKLYDGKTTYGFQFSSKRLVRFLTSTLRLPHGKKYHQLCIPALFYLDHQFLRACIRGIFDTDGCISFKRRHKKHPYYPVISIASKSARFIKELATILQSVGLQGNEFYNQTIHDTRIDKGFTTISRIEFVGYNKLNKWIEEIGTWHPKHQAKIYQYGSQQTKEKLKERTQIAGAGFEFARDIASMSLPTT